MRCASLAGLVLYFIACFILLVIAPERQFISVRTKPAKWVWWFRRQRETVRRTVNYLCSMSMFWSRDRHAEDRWRHIRLRHSANQVCYIAGTWRGGEWRVEALCPTGIGSSDMMRSWQHFLQSCQEVETKRASEASTPCRNECNLHLGK